MAAVVATKLTGPGSGPAPGAAAKMKKPSVHVQTSKTSTNKPAPPSASPVSTAKRLPGQAPVQTPTTATPTTATAPTANGLARPSRRPQRLNTRLITSDNVTMERKAIPPEPYVIDEKFILQKHKAKPPSLIVHLYKTQFKFEQQEGGFAYNSEMRPFIEGIRDKTIPHDLLEIFRQQGVRFYDGWLKVKIVDHRSASKSDVAQDDDDDAKTNSIHSYSQHVTPSPYVPYPTKEEQQAVVSPPQIKQERNASTITEEHKPEPNSVPTNGLIKAPLKTENHGVRTFYCALGPTGMSRYIDLQLDCLEVDPKSKKGASTNRAGAPPTPTTQFPPTPTTERPPPLKKQKLRIDPTDQLEYEAKILNATAPPLYLEPADTFEDGLYVIDALTDHRFNKAPPSPKSRKRTSAELAADDAHAAEQERFMMIMDPKTAGTNNAANTTVEGQSGTVPFQPRFEKFNALSDIKQTLAEKKQRDKDRQLQEDEMRRSQQAADEERRKQIQAANEANQQRQLAMQKKAQAQQAVLQQSQQMAQSQSQALANQRPGTANRPQPTAIPPNMQNQMVAQGQSPIIHQGTPQTASSPIAVAAAAANARPMVRNDSQTGGAGSPPRPGSSLQHGHPNSNAANMMRQQSSQPNAPSRHGTPHIPHSTPGMVSATPVLRQGTPNHAITQASPVGSMNMTTPQMQQAQMQNGVMRPQYTPEQIAQLRIRQAQAQAQANINGNTMAQAVAMHRATVDQQAAMRQQQAHAQAQAAMQQQGTPQQQHMSPSPSAAGTEVYNNQMQAQMRARLAQLQRSSGQGSPTPGQQFSPQQMQQLQQIQAMQQQMNGQGQQQNQQAMRNAQMSQQQRALVALTNKAVNQLMANEAQKYGGNHQLIPQQTRDMLQNAARSQAAQQFQKMQQQQRAANAAAGGQFPNQNQMMLRQMQMQQAQGGQMTPQMQQQLAAMNNMNPNMAAQIQHQQNQQAQQMQQLQMANAQQMMAQQQQQQHHQNNAYQQQIQQMQMQAQMMGQNQGQGQGQGGGQR